MDLPIKKPSMVSYADEMDFLKLLEELSNNKHNGFIRVTLGSEEGYILFSKGEQIAASYDKYQKVDAIEKIKDAMDEKNTLIEVFDVKESQIDFLKDLNKPYLLNSSSDYDLIMELKKSAEPESEDHGYMVKPETVAKHETITRPETVAKHETTNVEQEIEEEVKPALRLEKEQESGLKTEPVPNMEGTGEPKNEYESTLEEPVSEKEIEEVVKPKSFESAEFNVDEVNDIDEVKTFLEYQKPSAETLEVTENTDADVISEKVIDAEVQETIEYIKSSKLLHITGMYKEVVEEASKHANLLSLNPGTLLSSYGLKTLDKIIKKAHIIFLNKKEVKILTGLNFNEGAQTILNMGVPIVVVTCGKSGATVYTENDMISSPTGGVEALDTTGAGDAFAAGFIASFVKDKKLEDCLKMGNIVAAQCVGRLGALK
ncbi:MAG: PfkB family carbohydrate kinase [Methanobacterium paludis]|nr:PfkB family carbohydrate kinase [Methanobacterium paludis]